MRRVPATAPAADPGRWPDVATVPATTARSAAARLAFLHTARRLRLPVAGPGTGAADLPSDAGLVLRRPADFFRRLGADGPIGFGEAYMAGDWDTADLAGLFTALGTSYDRLVPAPLRLLRPLLVPGQARRGPEHRGLAAQHRAALRPAGANVRRLPG